VEAEPQIRPEDLSLTAQQKLEERGIHIKKQAALLKLGRNPQRMREIFYGTSRQSYQHVWNDEAKRIVAKQ
jgi:hypothetical protein